MRIIESFTVSRVEEGKVTGEGSVACYWITLATAPRRRRPWPWTSAPPANGQVTVSKSQVTLDASNWNSLTTERAQQLRLHPAHRRQDR